MKRFLFVAISLFIWLGALAQESKQLININPESFRPVQTDVLTGVNIDPIAKDRSQRECARIKLHVNRMTREEIDQLQVVIAGGNVALTKKVTSFEGNGLIIEMTAKPQTRFHIHHDKYGDSNQVTVDLEGNKVYLLDAQLDLLLPIAVASNVKGADVYIDEQYKGVIGENYMLTIEDVTPGEHKITIKHGAATAEQRVNVNSGNISFRVEVNDESSQLQYVVFELQPSYAILFINNEPQATQEGFAQALLQNGTYNYRVIAKGYHEQSGSFTVEGKRVVRKVELKADAAMVTLTTDPSAEIWINNQKKGTGSWSGQLSSGNYIFEARKEGCRTTKFSQVITSAQATQSYKLEAPTPIEGSLNITSVPALASVKVDGKPIGEAPLVTKLLVGKHTVEVSKSGYDTWRKEVVISEGQTATVSATLTKVVAAAPAISTSASTSSSGGNFDGFDMVFVKGGTFTMGATSEQGSDAYDTEKPTHSVTLSDFYIGKYEVTQAQWKAVMGSNPSYFKGDNLPVETVSWNDIQTFIQKLNAKSGKKYRLPTEAEWEYAARGGNQSRGYKYSGSNDIGSVAWYKDNSNRTTHPVGQKQPNELGIYDMSGNVYEWCSDWYGSYSSSSQTNPTGPSSGSRRVPRGGSWTDIAWPCRVSFRYGYDVLSGLNFNGFRLALDAGQLITTATTTTTTTSSAISSKSYKVGDYYNDGKKEGIVFWVDESGTHGKIVSLTESTSKLQWSSDEYEQKRLIGADSKSDGAKNMAVVKQIPDWQSKYPAFKWCADLGEGWYLPAIDELKLFTLDQSVHDAVNQTLETKGKKLSSKGVILWYWSSTELDDQLLGGPFAWIVFMHRGTTSTMTKYGDFSVRAVSAF